MEMISATTLTLPRATNTRAIVIVIKVAFAGSLSDFLSSDNHLFTFFKGKEESRARACNVLGATITDPMAEDKVEAARPKGIIMTPSTAILDIISWLDNISSALADIASL